MRALGTRRRTTRRRWLAATVTALAAIAGTLAAPATATPAMPGATAMPGAAGTAGGAAQAAEDIEVTDLPAGFQPTDINDRGRIFGRIGNDVAVVDDDGGPAVTVGPWEPFPHPLCSPGVLCPWPSSAPILNDRGVVATSLGQRATLWDDGETTDLNGGARGSWVLALNDRGEAVVARFTTDQMVVGLWHRGRFTEVGRWPLDTVIVARLSERGHVALTTIAVRPPALSAAVLFWHRGATTPVEGFAPIGIDDRGRLIGQTTGTAPVASAPAVWDGGEITLLPTLGGDGPHGTSYVNDRGQIAGYSRPPGGSEQSVVLWEDGGIVDVGASLGLRLQQLDDLTDRGQVLVGGFTPAFRTTAFVWEDGEVVQLPPVEGHDVNTVAMNDRGQVVGSRRAIGPGQPTIPTLWEL